MKHIQLILLVVLLGACSVDTSTVPGFPPEAGEGSAGMGIAAGSAGTGGFAGVAGVGGEAGAAGEPPELDAGAAGTDPLNCVPGSQTPCTCPSGDLSTATCLVNGSAYESCDCGQVTAGTGGAAGMVACTEDMCGVCDTDPSNDCVQDCAGDWGGTATLDACDTCDTDLSNNCAGPNALLVREEYDTDCNGIPNNCWLNTYDAAGNLVERGKDWFIGNITINGGCDGVIDSSCNTFSYDSNGYKTRMSQDTDCDGTRSADTLYSHNAEGDLLSIGYDNDFDGIPDYGCWSRTYDTNGIEIASSSDNDCDGVPNSCANSEVNGTDVYYETSDCNGSISSCGTKMLDADGNVISQESDTTCNGSVDTCLEYTYNELGRQTQHLTDNDCNGVYDFCRYSSFDQWGNSVSFQSDSGCDGAESCANYSYTYDADGNILTKRTAFPCTQEGVRCITYVYDSFGRKVYEEKGCDSERYECKTFVYE